MEISLTPDTYTPVVNEAGNYVDKIPSIRNGIYCACGSRRDKIYTNSTFSAHTKSKHHQKWLQSLNENKMNYYAELIKCKEVISSQQEIIQKLENKMSDKLLTIDYLTRQLYEREKPALSVNLLDIE